MCFLLDAAHHCMPLSQHAVWFQLFFLLQLPHSFSSVDAACAEIHLKVYTCPYEVYNVQAYTLHKALSSFYLFFYVFWWTQGKGRIIWDSHNCVSKGDQSDGLYKLKKQTKAGVGTGRMETVQFPSKTCRNYLYLQKWMKDHSSLPMSAIFPSLTALPQNTMTNSPVAICHLSSQILTAVMDRVGQSSLPPTSHCAKET